jgi:hypothetical protein
MLVVIAEPNLYHLTSKYHHNRHRLDQAVTRLEDCNKQDCWGRLLSSMYFGASQDGKLVVRMLHILYSASTTKHTFDRSTCRLMSRADVTNRK